MIGGDIILRRCWSNGGDEMYIWDCRFMVVYNRLGVFRLGVVGIVRLLIYLGRHLFPAGEATRIRLEQYISLLSRAIFRHWP